MGYGLSRTSVAVFIGASSLVAVLLVLSKPAASQEGSAARCFGCSVDGKTTPMTDGHPDLSGLWGGGFGGAAPAATPAAAGGTAAGAPAAGRGGRGAGGGGEQFERTADGSILYDFSLEQGANAGCYSDDCQAPNQPPYNAEYMPKVKAIAKTEFLGTSALDPTKDCKPAGVPRSGFGGLIIQTPQLITMIRGDYGDRFIYIDGRDHPPDLEASYNGDSVGHWDGNTLVVDTIGLNDDTWVGGGDVGGTHIYTSIHSPKEHVIERWTRNGDTMTVETTIEDPLAFTKPWVLPTRRAVLNKNPQLTIDVPYFCDGGGMSALLRDHYVKPNPEDRDVKYKCSGHRCDDSSVKTNCTLANKQNCGK